jgi:hypothetical protein
LVADSNASLKGEGSHSSLERNAAGSDRGEVATISQGAAGGCCLFAVIAWTHVLEPSSTCHPIMTQHALWITCQRRLLVDVADGQRCNARALGSPVAIVS